MLANCSSLVECEKFLAEAVRKVKFIGQVELTEEEVLKLGALIKERLKNNLPKGIKYLAESPPPPWPATWWAMGSTFTLKAITGPRWLIMLA